MTVRSTTIPDSKGRTFHEVPITVWVCPSCGSYHGSSVTPDLTQETKHAKVEDRAAVRRATGTDVRGHRSECPYCPDRPHRLPIRVSVCWEEKEVDGEIHHYDPDTNKRLDPKSLPEVDPHYGTPAGHSQDDDG